MPLWLKVTGIVLLGGALLLFATPIADPPPETTIVAADAVLPWQVESMDGQPVVNREALSALQKDLVVLVRSMRSGRASVTGSSVDIRGIVTSNSTWRAALNNFRERQGDVVNLSIDVFVIDESHSMEAMCEKMFARVQTAQIEFGQSGSRLKPSAHASLDRIVSFLGDCEDTVLRITGHSDASGNAEYNRALSRQRAVAVADYLATGGISRERLQVAGKGADEPIADNDTLHGRARNRRIEFELGTSLKPN